MTSRSSPRLALLFLLGFPFFLKGQVDIRLETPKSSYLQFSSIPVTVSLKNLGAQDLSLNGTSDEPWLEIIVQSLDGLVLKPDRPFAPPSLTLRAGESRNLPLDLAPHFLVREPGGYRVRASLRLPSGATRMTEPLSFLVGRGEVVWSVPRGEGKDRRIFSLLKFYEDPNMGLYLQIEVPEQNQVFPSLRLGPYLPLAQPVAEFDAKNHLHVLYAIAPALYRITVVSQDGTLLREEQRRETLEKPSLHRGPDGLVDVRGGSVVLPAHLREKLSSLQARAGLVPAAR